MAYILSERSDSPEAVPDAALIYRLQVPGALEPIKFQAASHALNFASRFSSACWAGTESAGVGRKAHRHLRNLADNSTSYFCLNETIAPLSSAAFTTLHSSGHLGDRRGPAEFRIALDKARSSRHRACMVRG